MEKSCKLHITVPLIDSWHSRYDIQVSIDRKYFVKLYTSLIIPVHTFFILYFHWKNFSSLQLMCDIFVNVQVVQCVRAVVEFAAARRVAPDNTNDTSSDCRGGESSRVYTAEQMEFAYFVHALQLLGMYSTVHFCSFLFIWLRTRC